MDQVKFKGYAQAQGFQPIQAPFGVLSRMQEQTSRTLRGMQDNANALTSQRNEFEAALRSNAAKEQQNRESIYEFERQSRRSVQDARQLNQARRLESIKSAEPDIQNLTALADLSKTISGLVSDYGKKKKEEDLLYGQNLVFQYNLTPQKLAEYEAQKEQLSQAATAANKAANEMEFRGVPVEVFERVRGLSGWKLYGATRAYAQNGAQDYTIFRTTAADTPIPFGEGEITLSSAKSTEEWEYANSYIRNEFLKSYNGINPALLNEHLYPKMRLAESQERVSYQEARAKVLAENRKEETVQNLLGNLQGEDPAAGFIQHLKQQSGGDPAMLGAVRRETFETMAKLAASGILSREVVESIKGGTYLRNDGQVRPIGEDFKIQFAAVEDALYQREKRTVDEREFRQDERKKEFEKQVYDNLEKGLTLNQDTVDALIKQYEDEFDESAPDYLRNLKTRTTEYFEEKALDAYLQDLSNRNLLTTKELNRYISTNPDLVTKYKSQAQAGDNIASVPKSSLQAAQREIDARIKDMLKQTGTDQVDSEAFIAASEYASRIFQDKLRAEMSVGNVNPLTALDVAKQYVKNLLYDGYTGKGGPFQMKGEIAPNGKFLPNLNQASPFVFQSKIPDTIAARKRASQLRNQPSSFVESNLFLNQQEQNQLRRLARGQGGSFPTILSSIAAGRLDQNGNPRTILDIANAQLRLMGEQPIGASGADQIFRGLDPRWQIKLSTYPSTSNTFQAFSQTGNYKPLLDLIASRESMGYGQYDAMNRGGDAGGTIALGSANSVNVFGRGLSSMTVQEVIKLQTDRKVHAAGRYQIVGRTLRELMKGSYGVTGVQPTDRFDAATQDKLAIALLKGRAGRFLTSGGSLSEAVAGMGQEWIGLQNPKAQQLVTQRLQELKARMQAPPMRQPEMMRTNVVYRVGNIGPTSTGAHLHVGAKDGGFFHRNFLDKYIRVGKSKGPLSSGVTVGGGVFGAGRDYGTHKAWDFAFDDGTPVYLSNGAQVVGNRKTQHGDELVIQLPNGRQFYFLHGKAS